MSGKLTIEEENTMNNKIFLLIGMAMLSGHAHAIGTVFYSPDERAEQAAQDGNAYIYTLDGIVQRSAGKSAVWINGRAVTQQDPIFPKLIISRDHVLLGGKQIKVGESLDITSGQRILHLPTVKVTR